MKHKKVGILLPDGVGVRNFIYGLLPGLLIEENAEVTVFHFLSESLSDLLPTHLQGKIQLVKLPEAREGFKSMLYRQAKVFGQLYAHMEEDNSQVVLDMQFRHKPKSWKGKLMNALVHGYAKTHRSAAQLAKLDQKHAKEAQANSIIPTYQKILKEYGIETLFCTHQRASKAVPVLEAAKLSGIQTSTFIYSWDNLPKGRMAVMPDCYFVWSSFMKKQLLHYYPELDEKKVIITGTPQFEPYYTTDKQWSKEEFNKKLGVTSDRPVICYSGDDETTSPFDEYYLRDIAEAFRSIPEKERPQIIFRACPVDHSGRFDWVLKQFPEIVESAPVWKSFDGNWTQILPTYEDLELLVNITLHCDAVVNVASTMCFDFALFDKPGVFINYNQEVTSEKEPYYNLKRGYQFPHFKVVHELQPVHWLNSKEDIVEVFQKILVQPEQKSDSRKAWVQQMLDGNAQGASHRLAEAILNSGNE